MSDKYKTRVDTEHIVAENPLAHEFYVGNANIPVGGVRPYSTIAQALAKCQPYRGDVIYVLPGHSENCATAGAININVNGVHIKGLGKPFGRKMPQILLTAAAGSVYVSAPNVTIEGIAILGAFENITNAVVVYSPGVTFRNCDISSRGYNVGEMLIAIQGTNCVAVTDAASVATSLVVTSATAAFTADVVGGTWTQVSGTNDTAGRYTVLAYNGPTSISIDAEITTGGNMSLGVGGVSRNRGLVVEGCRFANHVATAGATSGIILPGSVSDVVIRNNYFVGAWSTGTIVLGSTNYPVYNCVVDGNTLIQLSATVIAVNVVAAASTGVVANNKVWSGDATPGYITLNGLAAYENYCTFTADKSGALFPAVA